MRATFIDIKNQIVVTYKVSMGALENPQPNSASLVSTFGDLFRADMCRIYPLKDLRDQEWE